METQKMLKTRKIAVLALTAVIVVALSLVLTCSAMDIPVMQPKLENAMVDPGESETWDQSFTYAVNGIFYDTVSITLEVYNLSLHEWTAIGDRTYTGTGEWQTLTWEDLKICSGKCEGTSSYRFKYSGSILLTESGPTIAPTTPLSPTVQMFKDASVKPAYGHYNGSFTYSVFAQLNKTGNITLEIFDISSYEWKAAGENQSYTETGEWQLLSWADVTNVSANDSAGVASYRFFIFDAGVRRESVVFYGPELGLYPTPAPATTVIYSGGGGGGGGISWRRLLEDEKLQILAENLSRFLPAYGEINPPELINATVTPKRGSWDESYDYCAVVEHPNKAEMWLTLKVYSPATKENYTISTRKINSSMYDESNITTVEWRDVKVFCEADVEAEESPKYYILYNDSINGSRKFLGPKLNSAPNLSYPMVIPESGTYGDLFVYKVNVSDEDGDDVEVTLHIVNSEGNWTNETHVIPGIEAKRGKTERWIFNEFTEEEASKTFRYYFSATEGIPPNVTTSTRIGPYIKPGLIEELSRYPALIPLIIIVCIFVVLFLLLRGKIRDTEEKLSGINKVDIEELLESMEKVRERELEGRAIEEDII